MSGGAPPGNKNGLKIKDPEKRQEAYRRYCKWISEGKTYKSFKIDEPDFKVSYKTMEKYVKENPVEFPPIHKEIAEASSLELFEELGMQMMKGKVKGAQPAIFQMFMRNKFDWDRETKSSNTNEPEARTLLERWENGSAPA